MSCPYAYFMGRHEIVRVPWPISSWTKWSVHTLSPMSVYYLLYFPLSYKQEQLLSSTINLMIPLEIIIMIFYDICIHINKYKTILDQVSYFEIHLFYSIFFVCERWTRWYKKHKLITPNEEFIHILVNVNYVKIYHHLVYLEIR